MAALDDSPRPGREPVITDEARTFIVNLACRKAKDLGYPHEFVDDAVACQALASAARRRDTPA